MQTTPIPTPTPIIGICRDCGREITGVRVMESMRCAVCERKTSWED
jgi:hypothetical protein